MDQRNFTTKLVKISSPCLFLVYSMMILESFNSTSQGTKRQVCDPRDSTVMRTHPRPAGPVPEPSHRSSGFRGLEPAGGLGLRCGAGTLALED